MSRKKASPLAHSASLRDLQAILTIVDGTLLKALPKTVDALWLNDENKAFKAHIHYDMWVLWRVC